MNNVQPCFIFPPVYWWRHFARIGEVELLVAEYWVKQSMRSQIRIATRQGSQILSIPTIKKTRTRMDEVQISNAEPWQRNWMRSLTTNYNNSAYFEFYKDELFDLIKQSRINSNLLNFNMTCLHWANNHLGEPIEFRKKMKYEKPQLIEPETLIPYYQVFEDYCEFIPGLSVLDVLFNLGPESGSFILQPRPSR